MPQNRIFAKVYCLESLKRSQLRKQVLLKYTEVTYLIRKNIILQNTSKIYGRKLFFR